MNPLKRKSVTKKIKHVKTKVLQYLFKNENKYVVQTRAGKIIRCAPPTQNYVIFIFFGGRKISK